jgi:hypothetical protein
MPTRWDYKYMSSQDISKRTFLFGKAKGVRVYNMGYIFLAQLPLTAGFFY